MTTQMERREGEEVEFIRVEKGELQALLEEVVEIRRKASRRFWGRLVVCLGAVGALSVGLINYATDRGEDAAMRVERQAAVDTHAVLCRAINSGVVGLEDVTFGPMREQLGGELSTLNGGIGVIAEGFTGETTTTTEASDEQLDPLSNPLVDEHMPPDTLLAAREEITKPCPPPTPVSNGG